MSDDVTFFDEIEAYCDRLSYEPGATVGLHVSTRSERFDVVVERWGAERRPIAELRDLPGAYFVPPPGADAHGCDWPQSVQIPLPVDARSGFYLVTLTAAGAAENRNVAHAGFVIRAVEETRRRALLVLGTNTWNAYNTWGGQSLYTGAHQVSFRRPWPRGLLDRPEVERDDRKARPVRFGEEADADGEIFQAYRMANGYTSAIGSTGWFTHERRFVEWAERAGYEFDYAVSSDFDEQGDALVRGYDLVLGVGHDEYWTGAARDVVDRYVFAGGNYASLSGNTMFWQVRLTDGSDHMICHKYQAHRADPVVADGRATEMAGLWCDPLVGRPEWTTLGAGSVFGLYHRFGQATPRGSGGFSIFRPDHWLMAGTGLTYGDLLGADHGVVGYETVGIPLQFDEWQLPGVRAVDGMPSEITVVGLAWSSNLGVGEYPKSIAATSDQGDLEFLAERFYGEDNADNRARVNHGNAAMVVCQPQGPLGGEVVTLGTTDWVFGLADDQRVAQVTANILDRYLA